MAAQQCKLHTKCGGRQHRKASKRASPFRKSPTLWQRPLPKKTGILHQISLRIMLATCALYHMLLDGCAGRQQQRHTSNPRQHADSVAPAAAQQQLHAAGAACCSIAKQRTCCYPPAAWDGFEQCRVVARQQHRLPTQHPKQHDSSSYATPGQRAAEHCTGAPAVCYSQQGAGGRSAAAGFGPCGALWDFWGAVCLAAVPGHAVLWSIPAGYLWRHPAVVCVHQPP